MNWGKNEEKRKKNFPINRIKYWWQWSKNQTKENYKAAEYDKNVAKNKREKINKTKETWKKNQQKSRQEEEEEEEEEAE